MAFNFNVGGMQGAAGVAQEACDVCMCDVEDGEKTFYCYEVNTQEDRFIQQ